MKAGLVFFLLLHSLYCSSQSFTHSLGFEINTGFETGWWIYNKGSDTPGIYNNRGWDRTHYAVKIPFGANLFYKVSKVKLGIGATLSLFNDKEMYSYEELDLPYDSTTYLVAKSLISFRQLALRTEVTAFETNKFCLSPILAFGFFDINTIHPQKGNFGRKTFWEIGITNEIKYGRLHFLIRPQYQAMTILPKKKIYENEKHHMYSLGVIFGLRYWISNK